MKIIIDTNLWISFIISKKLHIIDEIVLNKEIQILFCDELLIELEQTLAKPKLEIFIKNFSLFEMLDVFERYIVTIEIQSNINICRDIKDNFLLNLAVDGNADYLITGDKDLLILEQIENTKIITINEFKTLD